MPVQYPDFNFLVNFYLKELEPDFPPGTDADFIKRSLIEEAYATFPERRGQPENAVLYYFLLSVWNDGGGD